jgi:hypothetical protein
LKHVSKITTTFLTPHPSSHPEIYYSKTIFFLKPITCLTLVGIFKNKLINHVFIKKPKPKPKPKYVLGFVLVLRIAVIKGQF